MVIRKKAWAGALAIVFVAVVVLQSAPATAQAYDPTQDLPRETALDKALTKLGRGLANVMFGWAELPVTWDTKLKEGKPLAYLVCVAPVLGTARGVMRTGVGVYETVTFPYSTKEVNYESILEPEYIF